MKLELLRAGAGAGKTTNLCQMVCDAVAAGLDPARILATTFTRKAAAELKNRILEAMLASGRFATRDASNRLELATIGTVHSVAHAIIGKYALHLGTSPKLKVLDEASATTVQESLIGLLSLDSIIGFAERLELVGELPGIVVSLLNLKRGNRIDDQAFAVQMESSLNEVLKLIAPTGFNDQCIIPIDFISICSEIIRQIHRLGDSTKDTAKAMENLKLLVNARVLTWKMISGVGSIKAGIKSGANNLLDNLRTMASTVRRNPALEADLRGFFAGIGGLVLSFGRLYEDHKLAWGFVDYTDLEIMLLGLLERPDLQDCLKSDFSLVVVDEFQDTNPLQLAIFMRLLAIAGTTRWTGDPNQAIYGFRGADPSLSENVWHTLGASPDSKIFELRQNHRSQSGLVRLFNKVFPASDGFPEQNHKRDLISDGIERWIFESKNNSEDHIALASGIAQLHEEAKIAWRDIAVLMAGNSSLIGFAGELTNMGIPFNLELGGLFKTREGALFIAGLRLVSDKHDALAAVTILHIMSDPNEGTPAWLKERLEMLRSEASKTQETTDSTISPWQDDIRLARLRAIAKEEIPPSLVARNVVDTLGLSFLAAAWGNPAQRAMNIDKMIRLADLYEQSVTSSNSAATLSGMILHLEKLENNKDNSSETGLDAVTLTTYHGAKGLEWPVVILSELNFDKDPSLWLPSAWGASSIEEPLAERSLRYWVWPFGKTNNPHKKNELTNGCGLNDDALLSPVGINVTEKNDREKLRLLYVGMTRARDKLVVAHRKDKYSWLKEKLPGFDVLIPPNLPEGEHNMAESIGMTLRIRRLSPLMAKELRKPAPVEENWFQTPVADPVPSFTDRHHAPSKAAAVSEGICYEEHALGGTRIFPTGAKKEQFGAIGDAAHAYLAALPSMRSLNDAARERIANRCLRNHSVNGIVDAINLVKSGNIFEAWVASQYPGASWNCEVYGTAPRAAGGNWDGWIDLLIELPDNKIVLVDHKTAPLSGDQCLNRAREYSGQLTAYREMLEKADKVVAGAWIHFPFGATMVRVIWPT